MEVWDPMRQVLVLVLYVQVAVQRSKGSTGSFDRETDMQGVSRVMAIRENGSTPMTDWQGNGHTIQVVLPQASATGGRSRVSYALCRMVTGVDPGGNETET